MAAPNPVHKTRATVLRLAALSIGYLLQLMAELKPDCAMLTTAALMLRRHGQEICKSKEPLCRVCPVASECGYAREHGMKAAAV